MKVHLIKDGAVGKEVFSEVVDLLQSIDGPIKFHYDTNNIINFTEDDIFEGPILQQESFEKSTPPQAMYNSNIRSSRSLEFNFRPFKNFSFPLFRNVTQWTTIFDKCNEYRIRYTIPNDEFVILLTEVSNTNNWFACLDEKNTI